jgi:diguanylate cyclase (GGDEF)-like protein/PAS domain S-box-containing protein
VEVENDFVGMDDPENVVTITKLTDISDEMAAHEAVGKRERLFRRLAESLPAGLFQVDLDRSVVYANRRLAQILGIPNAGTLQEQLATVVEDDRRTVDAALDAAIDGGADYEAEVQVRLPGTGALRQCLMSVVALSDDEGLPGAMVSITDITESVRLREELRFRATFDALTGCHNRASTMAVLDRILLERKGERVAVIFVDLNKFKPVNDTHGHAAGDELLVEVAARLTSVLRQGDIVGRIGGDEFLLVCPGVIDAGQALGLSGRVRDRLQGAVEVAGHRIELTGSIGVALSVSASTSDLLIAQADAAMYESKRRGGEAPVLYADRWPSRRLT